MCDDNENGTFVEDTEQVADVALLSIKVAKLEEDLKLKTLECTEKEVMMDEMQTENYILKEESLKMKDDQKSKDALNEANLGRINDLEELNKKNVSMLEMKASRVDLLEPLVNKMMHEIKHLKNGKNADPACENNQDHSVVKKLKLEIKSKNKEIKLLKEQKSTLAIELRDVQVKVADGKNDEVVDKFILS